MTMTFLKFDFIMLIVDILQRANQPLIDMIHNLGLYRVASPFDRRVTALAWHPTNPNLLAAASKSGDIILLDVNTVDTLHHIYGVSCF